MVQYKHHLNCSTCPPSQVTRELLIVECHLVPQQSVTSEAMAVMSIQAMEGSEYQTKALN